VITVLCVLFLEDTTQTFGCWVVHNAMYGELTTLVSPTIWNVTPYCIKCGGQCIKCGGQSPTWWNRCPLEESHNGKGLWKQSPPYLLQIQFYFLCHYLTWQINF